MILAVSIARRGLSLISRLARSIIDWQRQQSAIIALNSLDNRQLKDIGISRSDIPYIVVARRNRRRS